MSEVETQYPLHLMANGEKRKTMVRGSDTLLYIIREKFGLTGAKPSCENGDCGGCTVLVDEVPMYACLMLAMEAHNRNVTTIEGLSDTPIQAAFLDKMAYQCGYCTPGFIIKSHALVTAHPDADAVMISEWLDSNLCRCTSYQEIREAVLSVTGSKMNNRENDDGNDT